jgi:chromosome segregation ATPase
MTDDAKKFRDQLEALKRGYAKITESPIGDRGDYVLPVLKISAIMARSDAKTEDVQAMHDLIDEAMKAALAQSLEDRRDLSEAVDELVKERDQYHDDLVKAHKERDQWKANHDNQVKIRRAVCGRPDLHLVEERRVLAEALAKADEEIDRLRQAMGERFDAKLQCAKNTAGDVRAAFRAGRSEAFADAIALCERHLAIRRMVARGRIDGPDLVAGCLEAISYEIRNLLINAADAAKPESTDAAR